MDNWHAFKLSLFPQLADNIKLAHRDLCQEYKYVSQLHWDQSPFVTFWFFFRPDLKFTVFIDRYSY